MVASTFTGLQEATYRNWLRQLASTAIDAALRYRAMAGGGRRGGELCMDLSAEDRGHITAEIYVLLMQWSADFSRACRSRIAIAAHVFEEALSQMVPCKQDYLNPFLLERNLRELLRHFAAENLHINGSSSSLIPSSSSSSPTGQLREKETVASLLSLEKKLSLKEAAELAVWHAIAEEKTTSKKLVRRIVNLVLKKPSCKDARGVKHELRQAMAEGSVESLTRAVQGAAKMGGSDIEVKELCDAAEEMLVKQLLLREAAGCAGDGGRRRRKGRTLREKLRLGCADDHAEDTFFTPESVPNMQNNAISPSSSLLTTDSSPLTSIHDRPEQAQASPLIPIDHHEQDQPSSPITDHPHAFNQDTEAPQPDEIQTAHEISPSPNATSSNRVSLMRLLQEGDDGSSILLRQYMERNSLASYMENGGNPWEKWEEPSNELDPLCCVCMVGLKGAAFVPCGHTFCRKCSRELWKGRGTCPLCNKSIREILDIY